MLNKKLFYPLLITTLFIIDQIIKYYFLIKKPVIELKIVILHLVKNTGASFGLFQGNNILLGIISLLILVLITIYFSKIPKNYHTATILIITGTIGNLFDRITKGFVVDMIDLKIWPVFNIADSLIVIGVTWIIILMIIEEIIDYKIKSKKKKITTKKKVNQKNN